MKIGPVQHRDVPALMELMRGLAKFEKLPPPDASAARRIRAAIRKGEIHALLAWDGSAAVGYAIYLFTFSSFLARPTFFLEDIFVRPDARRSGTGRKLFEACRRAAKHRSCGRMEWTVLTWNTSAQQFYRRIGAKHLKAWMMYRLTLRKDAW